MYDSLIDSSAQTTGVRRVSRRKLEEYISEGEGLRIEFKRYFTSGEKIAKEMIALANTKGGVIIFGVDDDGSVVGIHSEKSELEEIEHTSEFFCEPPINIHCDVVRIDSRNDIVVVTIPESADKPHTLIEYEVSGVRKKLIKPQGFVRVGSKSLHASDEVMKVMRGKRKDAPPLQIAFGHNEKVLFTYLHKYERITVDEFADLVNISKHRASKILVDLVRVGSVLIHTIEMREFYTLAE
jgi:hypothetical protein